MSIRARVFTVLLAMTGIVWLSACAWIYTSTKERLEHVMDARLVESAKMVSSLVGDRSVVVGVDRQALASERDLDAEPADLPSYERQLACQIWSVNGELLSKSDSAPIDSLSDHGSGFRNTVIKGAPWRVYAIIKQDTGVRVLVGDSLEVRARLVDDVIKGLLYPAALIMPLMAGLIWLSVSNGLAPLQRLAASLTARDASQLHPFVDDRTPSELRPMIRALNSLLSRVQSAREREQEFITYAAHELKTPLAGLKTQAQVAMRTIDPAVQQQALKRIEQSVDRTSRMARQLIDLAAVDAAGAAGRSSEVDVGAMIREVAADLEVLTSTRDVRIAFQAPSRPSTDPVTTAADPSLLRLAIRNVMENAVQHAPQNSVVDCSVARNGRRVSVLVSDGGPGIAVEEEDKVLQRFYRTPRSAPGGSGLGLAIVKTSVERLGGRLSFYRGDARFEVMLEI